MIKLALIGLVFLSVSAHAIFIPPEQAERAKHGDLMNYFLASVPVTGISQADFNLMLDKIESHYQPVVQKYGYFLSFRRLWNDGTVNSDTSPEGNTWVVNSYGGLARYQGMTPEGYLLVAAHEVCHHMGKAPCYAGQCNWPGSFGPANEGESDYCASRLMKEMGMSDQQIRSAAQALGNVLASLGGEALPSPNTPDRTVVASTNDNHPRAQCRLDTYLAGNACPATGPFSPSDPKVNSCYYYPDGVASPRSRPRCWFRPVDQGSPDAPAPTPTPGPSPTPRPSPTPGPSPTPKPSPSPAPTPSGGTIKATLCGLCKLLRCEAN